jgi:hypothetical protein
MQDKINLIEGEDNQVSGDFSGTIFVSFSKQNHVLEVIK